MPAFLGIPGVVPTRPPRPPGTADSADGYETASGLLYQPISDQWTPQDRLGVMCNTTFDRIKDNAGYAAQLSFYLFAEYARDQGAAHTHRQRHRAVLDLLRVVPERTAKQLHPELHQTQRVGDRVGLLRRTDPASPRTVTDMPEPTIDHDGVAWRTYPFGALTLIDYFSEPMRPTERSGQLVAQPFGESSGVRPTPLRRSPCPAGRSRRAGGEQLVVVLRRDHAADHDHDVGPAQLGQLVAQLGHQGEVTGGERRRRRRRARRPRRPAARPRPGSGTAGRCRRRSRGRRTPWR